MNHGPYIKSKNNKSKIIYNILISLIPFILYKLYLTNIKSILPLLISIVFSILTSVIFDTIKNYKDYKFNYKDYLYTLVIGIIIHLFIPYNTPLLLLALTTSVAIIINKIFKNINPILIVGLVSYWYFILTNNEIIKLNINLYILILISAISFIYLLINKAIKFRITLIFLILSILSLFMFNIEIYNIYVLIILSIYVICELYSTPNTALACILYALILSILYVIFPLQWFIFIALIINILNKYLDLNVAIYLVNKN